MTTSTLNYAAQSADSALEHERQVLHDLRRHEAMLNEDLDRTEQRAHDLREKIGETGRDVRTQEQRLATCEQAMTAQTEALIKTMAKLGLEPQPHRPAEPVTDALGLRQDATLPDAGPLAIEPLALQSHEANPNVTQGLPAMQTPNGGEVTVTNPDGPSNGDTQMLTVRRGGKVVRTPVKGGESS